MAPTTTTTILPNTTTTTTANTGTAITTPSSHPLLPIPNPPLFSRLTSLPEEQWVNEINDEDWIAVQRVVVTGTVGLVHCPQLLHQGTCIKLADYIRIQIMYQYIRACSETLDIVNYPLDLLTQHLNPRDYTKSSAPEQALNIFLLFTSSLCFSSFQLTLLIVLLPPLL